jgi:hypothetical protein
MKSMKHVISRSVLTLIVYEAVSLDIGTEHLKLVMQGVSARLSSPRPIAQRSGKVDASQLIASRLAEVQGKAELSIGFTKDDYLNPTAVRAEEERVDQDSDDDSEDEPCHYEDMLMSLSSEHKSRFEGALRGAAKLIRQELPELDLLLGRLAECLVRVQDKFSTPTFQADKTEALTELAVVRPIDAVKAWKSRLASPETPLGEKEFILDAMREAARRLSQLTQCPEDPPLSLKVPSKGKTRVTHLHRAKPKRSEASRFLPAAVSFIGAVAELDPSRLESFTLVKALNTLASFFEVLGKL